MKFVALALALLLAVGSQAASLPTDAAAVPSQLAHIRAAMDVYITQLKDSAQKALAQLDDTEYSGIKDTLSQRLEDMHTQMKNLQVSVSPVTDNVVTTINDATAELRASIAADIEALKLDLEPKRAVLREVIDKHIAQYHTLLDPILTSYAEMHKAEMAALKAKLEPVVEELKAAIAVNVEETKTALMPIVESVRAKVAERLQVLKDMASPYVAEYKEHLQKAYSHAQNINPEELTALREKITPLAEEIKVKLQEIFESVATTVTKN